MECARERNPRPWQQKCKRFWEATTVQIVPGSISASEFDEVLCGLPECLLEMMTGMQVHASAYPTWRTPEPGMLLAACEAWGIEPREVVFGGGQDADRQAAAAAGVRYVLTLAEVLALVENEA